MDRLMSMRVFQRVMDEGSFAAAARSLDLSPAVVTRLVADLEEHLGARLLHRSTRKLALTDAGESYLRRLRAILQDIDEADALASAHTQTLSGVLRVTCQPIIATHVLAPLAALFHQRYPHIVLEVAVAPFLEPEVEEYDMALFATDASYDGDVIARRIVSTQTILVAHPAYLRTRGTPTTPQDLAQHACLRLSAPHSKARPWVLRDTQGQHPEVTLQPPCPLLSNHIDMLLRAALDGAGVVAASLELVAPYLANGQLVQVLPGWSTGELVLLAALPTRKFLPQRTRVFLDFLTEQTRQLVNSAGQCHAALV